MCAGNGIGVAQNDAVELFAAASCDQKFSRRNIFFRQCNAREMSFAVGGKELIFEQPWAAVLEVIAFLFQIGDSLVSRNHAVDFIADVLGIMPGKDRSGAGSPELAGDLDGNLPFIA